MSLIQKILVTAFGSSNDFHVIHYICDGKKNRKLLAKDHEWAEGFIDGKMSQHDALEVAEKFEQDKINKSQTRKILHPVFAHALKPFVKTL